MPLLLAADSTRFDASLLALGCLLVIGALVSGLAGRSFLSLTALFVIIGFALGPGGTDAIHLDARSSFVGGLATVALIVILFRDGLEVDGEMLQKHWRLPLRKLVLAMPLTAIIIAVAAHVVDRSHVDRVVPARGAALPHRSGPVVQRRHQPARPRRDPPLAQPRVGAQRRPRTAGGARARGGALVRTATSSGGDSCSRT